MKTWYIALLTLPLFFAPVQAEDWGKPAVGNYLQSLSEVEQTSSPTSLEACYAKAGVLQDVFMEIVDGQARLEQFSESQYAQLKDKLRGIALSREQEIFAQPDPAFFYQLAKTHGRPEDIDFFALQTQYWGKELFPVYMERRSSIIGCVRYGDSKISELYNDWSAYARTYPQAYTAPVAQMLKDIEETVSLGTCACNGEANVIKELIEFSTRFPQSAVNPEVLKRIDELKHGTATMPVYCR